MDTQIPIILVLLQYTTKLPKACVEEGVDYSFHLFIHKHSNSLLLVCGLFFAMLGEAGREKLHYNKVIQLLSEEEVHMAEKLFSSPLF